MTQLALIQTPTPAPDAAPRNPIHAHHRAAKPYQCPRCGHWILAGLSDDHCAHTASADPTPLNDSGDLACAVTGRATYRLIRNRLYPRTTPDDLTALRPVDQPVIVAHRCHEPIPPSWHDTSAAPVPYELPDEPPF